MPYRLEIIYMSDGSQAPVHIEKSANSLKNGLHWRSRPCEGDIDEVTMLIDIPLGKEEYEGLDALMLISNPLNYSPAITAVELAIEAAFLAGIQYARKTKSV